MTETSIADAVHEAGVLLRADGADLHLVNFDATNSEVRVAVDLSSSNCADCIIPPELLASVLSDAINTNFGSPVTVLVNDPRVDDNEE